MSHYSVQYSCDLHPAERITKYVLDRWIRDYAISLNDQVISSDDNRERTQSLANDKSTDHAPAVNEITDTIWSYVHWCETKDADRNFIHIHCDTDDSNCDVDLFADIAWHFSQKTENKIAEVNRITIGCNTGFDQLFLAKKDGEVRFVESSKVRKKLLEAIKDEDSVFNSIL